MQRRGFLQLLGLGATGAATGLPLFGTESLVSAAHLPLITEHLVVSRGKTRGVVETIHLDGTFQGIRMGRRPTEPAPDGQTRLPPWVYLTVGAMKFNKLVIVREGQDPYVEFHVQALELQQTLQRQALMLLGSREAIGKTLVTVVKQPIQASFLVEGDGVFDANYNPNPDEGDESFRGYYVSNILRMPSNGFFMSAHFTRYLVEGEVMNTENRLHNTSVLDPSLPYQPPPPHQDHILSTQGEFPIDRSLDIDRLIWTDDRIRNGGGKIILA